MNPMAPPAESGSGSVLTNYIQRYFLLGAYIVLLTERRLAAHAHKPFGGLEIDVYLTGLLSPPG